MAAPLGNKFSPGRPKGSKNKKSQQWEKFAEWFMEEGMNRLRREMALLKGKDFVIIVKDLLEYFKPKLARVENKHEGEVSVVTGFKLKPFREDNKDDKKEKEENTN